jgi:hypothetical protein
VRTTKIDQMDSPLVPKGAKGPHLACDERTSDAFLRPQKHLRANSDAKRIHFDLDSFATGDCGDGR